MHLHNIPEKVALPKVLICSDTSKFINSRLMDLIGLFQKNDWVVDVACRLEYPVQGVNQQFDIQFPDHQYSAKNTLARNYIEEILDTGEYDIVLCTQPVNAAIIRKAAKKIGLANKKTKIIYALYNGFAFHKNLNLAERQAFYTMEKSLTEYTDLIIACNQEDLAIAKDRRFNKKQYAFVHGSGIDTSVFRPVNVQEKEALRNKLGISQDEIALICANGWEERHNQKMLIYGLAMAEKRECRLRLYLLGDGPGMQKLKAFVKSNQIDKWVHFPGYCNNIQEWMQAADVALSASEHTTLPVSLLEAMSCGIPVVASKVFGHNDIIVNRKSGMFFQLDDVCDLAKGVFSALAHQSDFGTSAFELSRLYSRENVLREMAEILQTFTGYPFSKGYSPKTMTEPDFISVQYAVR